MFLLSLLSTCLFNIYSYHAPDSITIVCIVSYIVACIFMAKDFCRFKPDLKFLGVIFGIVSILAVFNTGYFGQYMLMVYYCFRFFYNSSFSIKHILLLAFLGIIMIVNLFLHDKVFVSYNNEQKLVSAKDYHVTYRDLFSNDTKNSTNPTVDNYSSESKPSLADSKSNSNQSNDSNMINSRDTSNEDKSNITANNDKSTYSIEPYTIDAEYEYIDTLGDKHFVKLITVNDDKAIEASVIATDSTGAVVGKMSDVVNISKGSTGVIDINCFEIADSLDINSLTFTWSWKAYTPLVRGNTDAFSIDTYNISENIIYITGSCNNIHDSFLPGCTVLFFKGNNLVSTSETYFHFNEADSTSIAECWFDNNIDFDSIQVYKN